MERMLGFVVAQIANMRGTVTENVRTPVSAIAEYATRHMEGTLVINSETAVGGVLIGREPRRALRIRIENHTRKMYIDRADFRRFCTDTSVDIVALERELVASGVLVDKARRIVLGKGTQFGVAQVYAWMIDLNHPALGNVVAAAVPSNTAATSVSTG